MGRKKLNKVLKSTKYCDLLSQASLNYDQYTYCIERIYVKAKKMEEIRFTLYKDTVKAGNRYIPRSLDVTEIELIKLIRSSLEGNVFSSGFIKMLKEEINKV